MRDTAIPTLYIVPTPIGNLEDITLRALRILREVALIAAEDTRTTRVLLQHYDIHTPLTSYHEHNKLTKLDVIFDTLTNADVALVSDAGTPGISDPGYELIQAAIEGNVVALCDFSMVANDLSAGRLVRPFELGIRVSEEFAYHLVYPQEAANDPRIIAFRDWLLDEVHNPQMDPSLGA